MIASDMYNLRPNMNPFSQMAHSGHPNQMSIPHLGHYDMMNYGQLPGHPIG